MEPVDRGREHGVGMQFVKAHGTGNDFVLLPDTDGRIALDDRLTRALCDRRAGVGGDGVIRIAPPREGTNADVFMDYRNADGSMAETCGNGIRCVAKYVVDRGIAGGDGLLRVDTRAGVKLVEVTERDDRGRVAAVRVDMGAPRPTGTTRLQVGGWSVNAPRRTPTPPDDGSHVLVRHTEGDALDVEVTTLSMGNPHAVVLVRDVKDAPVAAWGPLIERHASFPEGTNVEFIAVPSPDLVEGRIWERGVGETMASGSGAAAMAAAAHLLGLAGRDVTVRLPGGSLRVEWTEDTLYVTGPAVEVAEGELDEAWITSTTGA